MFWEIDKNIQYEYELVLCKPDRTQITVLDDAYGFEYEGKFPTTDEMRFNIPYYVMFRGEQQKNKNWDLIKGDYLILVNKIYDKDIIDEKYFIINSINEVSDDTSTRKSVECFSYEYKLNKRIIREYNHISRRLYSPIDEIDGDGFQVGVLNYISTLTSWSIGNIDAELINSFRSINIGEMTLLSFLTQEIQKIFGCIFIFDTVNKKIHARKIESVGINQGFYISEENYIKSIDKKIEHDEIVTRLHVYGKDNISINSISPTGQTYIEDFSYYKTPEYMSQELIDALNAYENLIETRTPQFQGYLQQLETLNQNLSQKRIDMFDLETELQIIEDNIDQAIRNGDSLASLNGQKTAKQTQIDNKQSEIDSIYAQIDSVHLDINSLRDEIDKENNFTPEQIIELDEYVYEKTWSDSSYEDAEDLFVEGKNVLNRFKQPPLEFEIDSIDFLSIVECQRDWKKFLLGDIVNIEYSKLNVDIQVRLVGYNHNPDDNSLKLIFSNKNSIDSPLIYLNDILTNAIATSTTVDMSRYKWDKSEDNTSQIDQIINSALDTSKNKVLAGRNQNVIVDDRGIHLLDLTSENEQIRMINNVIAFTDNNWTTASLAITPQGVYAPAVYGHLLAGSNLVITNESGNFLVDGDKVTVDGLALEITGGLPPSQLDPTFKDSLVELNKNYTNGIRIDTADGIVVTRSDNNVRTILNATTGISIQSRSGSNWVNKLYADTNGDITLDGNLTRGSGNNVFKATSQGIQLGHDTFNSAPFRVTTSGQLTATNANITGAINATSGTFSGNINVSGTLSGGTFSSPSISSGSINGTTITGATINGGTINVTTDIHVGNNIYLREGVETSKTIMFSNVGQGAILQYNPHSSGLFSMISYNNIAVAALGGTLNLQGNGINVMGGSSQGTTFSGRVYFESSSIVNFQNAEVLGLNTTARFG